MAVTFAEIKDLIARVEEGGIDSVYQRLIANMMDAVVSFEKDLLSKMEVLEADGTLTKTDVAQIIAEIRWQAISSLAAKAGFDIGLRESTVAGEVLQKYESLSTVMLSKKILGAMQNLGAQDDELDHKPEAKEKTNLSDAADININTFISSKKNTVLN